MELSYNGPIWLQCMRIILVLIDLLTLSNDHFCHEMAADSSRLIEKISQDFINPFQGKFRAEKITTDIVCKLFAHTFQALCMSNTRDMMRFTNNCVKYGTLNSKKFKRAWPQCGPPMYMMYLMFHTCNNRKHSLKTDAQFKLSLSIWMNNPQKKGRVCMKWNELFRNIWHWPWFKRWEVPSLWRNSIRQMITLKG